MGARLYPRCRAIAEAAEGSLDEVAGDAKWPRGLLTAAASRTFGKAVLADVAIDDLLAHPDVRLDLRLEDRQFQIVSEGIDLCFQVIEPTEASLIARSLGPARSLVVAAPGLIAGAGAADDLPWIEWRALPTTGATPRALPRLGVSSVEVAIAAALRGVGATVAPEMLVRDHLASGRLTTLPTATGARSGQFWVVYPSRHHLSAKVRLFLDMTVSRFEAGHAGQGPFTHPASTPASSRP